METFSGVSSHVRARRVQQAGASPARADVSTSSLSPAASNSECWASLSFRIPYVIWATLNSLQWEVESKGRLTLFPMGLHILSLGAGVLGKALECGRCREGQVPDTETASAPVRGMPAFLEEVCWQSLLLVLAPVHSS